MLSSVQNIFHSRTTTGIRRLDEKDAYKRLGSLVAMLPSDEDSPTHTQASLLFLAAERINYVNKLRQNRHSEITTLREKIKELNSDLRTHVLNGSTDQSSSGSGSSETATDSNDNQAGPSHSLKTYFKMTEIFSK